MEITEVVDVQVSVQEAGVKGLDFGIPLILGTTGFDDADLVRSYGSVDEVAEDFETTDDEYKQAVKLFSQDLEPDHILIGFRETATVAQVTTVTVTAADLHVYTVIINGVEFNFVSDADGTLAEITAGLVAAINGGAEPVTAGGIVDGTFTLTADVAGTPFTVQEFNTNVSYALTTPNKVAQDVDEALDAIGESGDLGKAWFALLLTSRDKQDILDAAAWVETRTHAFIASSDDADVLSATGGNVAEALKAQGYKHTTYIWSGDADSFPDAALFGRVLPLVVGSWSLALQTLTGIVADELTGTQVANLKSQYASYYVNIGGRDTVQGGQSANGNWFDAYVGAMWIEVNGNVAIFNAKIAQQPNKVPYTDAGIQLEVNAMRGVLQQAEDNGILAPDPKFTISYPLARDISGAKKATRVFDEMTFEGELAGAIHRTVVRGKVTN